MPTLPIFLLSSRMAPQQRAHMGLFVSYSPFSSSSTGTLIHVLGSPFTGYAHEFKRGYNPSEDAAARNELIAVAEIDGKLVNDWTGGLARDTAPLGEIEKLAAEVKAPGRSANPLGPVDGTKARDCQTWLLEFVEKLAGMGVVDAKAVDMVRENMDAPSHGISSIFASLVHGGVGDRDEAQRQQQQ